MPQAAPATPRVTAERYFALVDEGVLRPDDRVELLEGVIVSMAPQNPRHAAGTSRADYAVRAAIGNRATVRVQLPLVLSLYSVPEPDVAVVPGHRNDYDTAHPTTALLVIEVADASPVPDRPTKAAGRSCARPTAKPLGTARRASSVRASGSSSRPCPARSSPSRIFCPAEPGRRSRCSARTPRGAAHAPGDQEAHGSPNAIVESRHRSLVLQRRCMR